MLHVKQGILGMKWNFISKIKWKKKLMLLIFKLYKDTKVKPFNLMSNQRIVKVNLFLTMYRCSIVDLVYGMVINV